jgi:hypothetical protein
LQAARVRTAALVLAVWLEASPTIPEAGGWARPATLGAHVPAGQATCALSSEAAILARFVSRPDEPTRSFRAHRWLSVTSGALGKRAWMEVRVELDPRAGFRYETIAAGGSQLLQERILRKVLRAEQEVYASGGNPKTALTPENYTLAPGGCDERGLVRLLATARRKEVGLLNGQLLVTPDTADLVEVTGTMAKGPSFWIPRIDMIKRYERVGGHRMNVQVDSVSHVRLLGESRFTMTTEYESIDGDTITPAALHEGH